MLRKLGHRMVFAIWKDLERGSDLKCEEYMLENTKNRLRDTTDFANV